MDAEHSLVPGYAEVEEFGRDEEYEQVGGDVAEEVAYVTLDLGSIEPTLVPSSSAYRIIGLDGPTPFLQLSGTVFKGEHLALLGTELIFTDTKDDINERNKKGLAHVANTERRIRFKEVELKPKNQIPDISAAAMSSLDTGSVPSRKRVPGSVEELVGNESVKMTSQGRGRRGRGKLIAGKTRSEVVQPEIVTMDTSEG